MYGNSNRREFLKSSIGIGAGLALAPSINVLGANDRVRIGVIGVGGQGSHHMNQFGKLPDVDIVAVSDPDITRMQKFGDSVKQIQDFRDLLELPDIDAVVIASPNHWHAPMTVAACQAGKDVYVEKPLSHSIWGGKQMAAAAAKYDRVVGAGTQQRSCPAPNAAGEDIRAGKYGAIKWIHCQVFNLRDPIGLVSEPQAVPGHIDYNLWAGPAPMTPVMRKNFHYDLHWQWNWGDGEFGNWAVHYLDDLCNMLKWETPPTSALSAGGRFVWKDNGETPNMQFVLMERDGVNIVVETRNLPISPERKAAPVYLGRRHGNIIQCEHGVVKIARGGGAAYDNDGKEIKKYPGNGGRGHHRNFIDAVKSRRKQDLAAPVEGGVLSALICQQGNISQRLAKQATLEEVRANMKQHEDALATIDAVTKQLNDNSADLGQMQMGPKIVFDVEKGRFVGENAAAANKLARYEMRKEFAIPEEV